MRKLALTLVPLMLLRSTSVFALGVGDIELHSALNQPLNAEIRLLSATPAEIQGLTVALAPEAAFASAGVERLGLLHQLRFKVVQRSDGSHVIKITSAQPIREPFLDFLVEVNWPSGRFIREYTVLLDFPVLEGGKPAPLDTPVTAPARIAKTEPASPQNATPTVEAESADDATDVEEIAAGDIDQDSEASPPKKSAPRAFSPRTATLSDGNYGPTQRADTLWDIALKMRPDPSVSVSQVMVALAKNNPQAFFGNNINNLMAGYILRLPPVNEIHAIPREDAVREIAGQYQQWLNVQRGGMAVPSAPAATARDSMAKESTESTPQPGKTPSGAQLKLTTPDTAGKTSASGGDSKTSSNDTGDVAALRKELAVALEAVDANRQENAELRARMTHLEQQLASMQRLLELKDSNLAALQNKNAATAPVITGKPAATAPAASAPATRPAVPPAPAATPVESQETDLLGSLLGNQKQLGLLIGGFLLISALVWVMVRRRRQSAIDSADASFAKLLQNSAVTPEGEAKKAQEEPLPDTANDLTTTVLTLSSAQADEDMIDPLAEADVYLAYKRYDQAAELIKDAIRNDPTRADLSLKLLEIYHLAQNTDAFETQAETLYAELNGDSNHPLWAKAREMGKQTAPTHPLFSKVTATATAMNSSAGFMVDTPEVMATGASMPDATPESLTPPPEADHTFTLDMPSHDVSGMDKQESLASTDNSIEFSLETPSPQVETTTITENSAPAEIPPPLSNTMDFDISLSDTMAIPSSSNDLEPSQAGAAHGNGHDTQATPATLNLAEFNLDASDVAAFDGTAPDETTPASDTEDDLFGGIDMVGTKLDLAKAYIDMEDNEGARMLLNEIMEEGSAPQKNEAQVLMQQIA